MSVTKRFIPSRLAFNQNHILISSHRTPTCSEIYNTDTVGEKILSSNLFETNRRVEHQVMNKT